jgi:hypothetical protein
LFAVEIALEFGLSRVVRRHCFPFALLLRSAAPPYVTSISQRNLSPARSCVLLPNLSLESRAAAAFVPTVLARRHAMQRPISLSRRSRRTAAAVLRLDFPESTPRVFVSKLISRAAGCWFLVRFFDSKQTPPAFDWFFPARLRFFVSGSRARARQSERCIALFSALPLFEPASRAVRGQAASRRVSLLRVSGRHEASPCAAGRTRSDRFFSRARRLKAGSSPRRVTA